MAHSGLHLYNARNEHSNMDPYSQFASSSMRQTGLAPRIPASDFSRFSVEPQVSQQSTTETNPGVQSALAATASPIHAFVAGAHAFSAPTTPQTFQASPGPTPMSAWGSPMIDQHSPMPETIDGSGYTTAVNHASPALMQGDMSSAWGVDNYHLDSPAVAGNGVGFEINTAVGNHNQKSLSSSPVDNPGQALGSAAMMETMGDVDDMNFGMNNFYGVCRVGPQAHAVSSASSTHMNVDYVPYDNLTGTGHYHLAKTPDTPAVNAQNGMGVSVSPTLTPPNNDERNGPFRGPRVGMDWVNSNSMPKTQQPDVETPPLTPTSEASEVMPFLLGKTQGGIHHCKHPGCTKSFARKSDLTKHEQYHSKTKKCLVKGCGAAFSTSKDLNRHCDTTHGLGKKYWVCTYAGCCKAKRQYKYNRFDNYKRHVMRHPEWEMILAAEAQTDTAKTLHTPPEL